jgi:TolB-like protein/DNA-binding winged helix-turn-helix (wHTH) protein
VQRFGDFSFDAGARELRRGQESLHLSPKCFELLELLLAERPRVVPKVRLYEGLWPKTFVSESSLTKLVTELRAVLGDDAQTPRFVRTAHRFGYAFCADVVDDTGPAPRSKDSPDSLSQGEREIRPPEGETVVGRTIEDLTSRRRVVVVGVVVAGLALVLGGAWLAQRGSHVATPAYSAVGPKRMAVLPFENLGAAEDGYFADGMTDEVRSKLARLSGLTVIASTSASQYKATTKPPEQIAKELGVGYLLVAKVRWQKSGTASRIRVTSELVEVAGGSAPTTRWQEAFEADLQDVFRVQGEIAAKVAQSLEVALSGKERGPLTAPPTSKLAAYDAYLKGLEIEKEGYNPTTQRRTAAQYEQAVALDPGFALAWAGLSISRSLSYRGGAPSPQEAEAARKAADRAMGLAPSMPEAHRALGDYYRFVEKDSEKAIDAYTRGLKHAPDDALLLQALAGAEPSQGRWEEALAHLRRARELDPRSWQPERQLANTLLFLRRPDEMRAACDRGLVLAPANLNLIELKAVTFLQEGDLAGARTVLSAALKQVEPTALVAYFATYDDLHWVLEDPQRDVLLRLTPGAFDGNRGVWGFVMAQASAQRGDQAKTREYAEEARRGFAAELAKAPEDAQRHVLLGLALAYLGRKAEAGREGERGAALSPSTKYVQHSRYIQHQLVRIHILAGNHEKALDLLEKLLRTPYQLTAGWLRIDPNFDPLRGNPRFEKLAQGT